jgi:hypothetical protein
VMRHILPVGPADTVACLASGMMHSASPRLLIAAAGGAERGLPGPLCTDPHAVALSAITVPAQKEQLAAVWSCADDEPERIQVSPRSGGVAGQSRGDMR